MARPTWRELDKEGCVFGQHTAEAVAQLCQEVKEGFTETRQAQAKMTWALVGVAISVATAALVMLATWLSAGAP